MSAGGIQGTISPLFLKQIKKIKKHGLKRSIKIYPEFQGNRKMEFFNDVDV
jgi:hypothetical protein